MAVSAFTLTVDISLLYLCVTLMHLPGYAAAFISYSAGLAIHYILSVRYVFTYRRMEGQPHTEAVLYAFTGILGILMSTGIVYLGEKMGRSLVESKLIAIMVTFAAVFAFRKAFLFSRSPPVDNPPGSLR